MYLTKSKKWQGWVERDNVGYDEGVRPSVAIKSLAVLT